jgi:hypothetical protein
VQAWAIGQALSIGLQIYQCSMLKILTPALPSAPVNCSPGSVPRTGLLGRQAGDKLPSPGADLRVAVLICQIAQELCLIAEVFPDRDRVPGYAM